jgi:hypothetical protein
MLKQTSYVNTSSIYNSFFSNFCYVLEMPQGFSFSFFSFFFFFFGKKPLFIYFILFYLFIILLEEEHMSVTYVAKLIYLRETSLIHLILFNFYHIFNILFLKLKNSQFSVLNF